MKIAFLFILILIILNGNAIAVQTGRNADAFGSNVGIGTTTPQDALTIPSGNVGVGTWAPSQLLDVVGTLKATVFVGDGSALSGIGPMGWGTSNPGNIFLTTATNNIGLGTTTPQGNFVITNGNVGLGTWVASSLLQVNNPSLSPFAVNSSGNAGIGTLTPQGSWVVTGGNTGIGTWAPILPFQVNDPLSGFAVTSAGNIGSGTTTPQAKTVVLGNVGIGTWTADGGNLIIRSGNIGINTVTPGEAIDVQGTFRVRNGGSASYFMTNVGVGSITPGKTLDVQGTVRAITFEGDASLLTNLAASGWSTSGTNVFVTTLTNNVGIGTTTPEAKLSVIGNMGIGTWTAEGGNLIIRRVNVGIGSAFPGKTLDLQGTLRATAITGDASLMANLNPTIVGWTANTTGVYVSTLTNNLGIGTSDPQTMLAVSYGNVGIGTWTADTGALIVRGGNVGIGTASAAAVWTVKGAISQIVINNTDAATVTTDVSKGSYFRWTTTQDFLLANPTNPIDGQKIIWEIIQDGSGNHVITLDTKFVLGGDITAVVLSTAGNLRDFLSATYNGSTDKWYVTGFMRGY